jgi:hypothetical protein
MSENDDVVTFGGDQGRGQASAGQDHNRKVQPEDSGRSEPTNTVAQSGLTKEEAVNLLNDMKSEILSTTERWMTSQFDKRDSRLEKSIKEIQTRADKLGLDPNDPAIKDAIDSVKRKVLNEEFDVQGNRANEPAQANMPKDPLSGYVASRQAAISKEYGVIVTEDDPEAQNIDQSSMESFLTSYQAAAAAKKDRIAQAQQPKASPAARIPSLGQGSASKEDWYQKYQKEIDGKSSRQRLEVRRKYRDEGYPL